MLSTSGTQTDSTPVYDLDRSAEVHHSKNCYDNDIFNMFIQEEQYTELLEPIPEPHQVQQNDSNVIFEVFSVEQGGGTVEQHPATVEETRAYFESLYNNFPIEVEKANMVNRKLRETNADLTIELARYKNQEKCFEISQEKYDKLERCYQKFVYQEQCLTKKINALHLSSEFSDDTTPSVARKFLNEVKSTIVTLQRVVKQKMTLDIHIWSSSVHQEIHKIVKDENFPIVNQVDGRLQNFEIQFLKEAAKFVRDFKSLSKEADESLVKHKALELEIERLLRAVVSQDIMSIVQSNSVVDTSNLQTELERTKERYENCIIKKENEYAKIWNDWYKKCEECKYDKILYNKTYNDMQQKIERLQAQLGDQKGKIKDTQCVSDTLDPLSQKLDNENVELEFQVLNYAKENAHIKTTYKNLFDSISVFNQKDTTKGTSVNTQFRKQSILGKSPSSSGSKLYSVTPFPKSKGLPKIDETHALINPFKASRVDNFVPNKYVKASVRTKPITVSQPRVITKKDVNSITNGLSHKNIEGTTRARRPQPRNNPKSDKYVNDIKSRKKNQSSNVSKIENQKKHKANVKKSKMLSSKDRLASSRPSKPRICLKWLPTGRILYLCGKITSSSNAESESDTSVCDNASASNPQEPTNKGFPSSTFFLAGFRYSGGRIHVSIR
ncbi:hypothetical protein Tco_1072173 [Tanacetum coccineum]